MSAESAARRAHVTLVGNLKGGSGKSTIALALAIALLKEGQRVATIDADPRQGTLSRGIDNRRRWMAAAGLPLDLPWHIGLAPAEAGTARALSDTLERLAGRFDFIVVDTPGADTPATRFAHAAADTLLTPINDSFIDFDVLGEVDGDGRAAIGEGPYARMVKAARERRRAESGVLLDWIVVRNRLATLDSRNNRNLSRGLDRLGAALGFRVAAGLTERVIFRELFPRGVTVLDRLDGATLGIRPTLSHLAARREMRELVAALRLPLDERGRRRQEARRTWSDAARRPLAELDLPLG